MAGTVLPTVEEEAGGTTTITIAEEEEESGGAETIMIEEVAGVEVGLLPGMIAARLLRGTTAIGIVLEAKAEAGEAEAEEIEGAAGPALPARGPCRAPVPGPVLGPVPGPAPDLDPGRAPDPGPCRAAPSAAGAGADLRRVAAAGRARRPADGDGLRAA
mmetsp:Transcript_36147/g.108175  ORF Transcript_36147/g.108175 Transcript_36147/m.108175 type:complete len:159 (-) Transcript_36147:2858-3334(-)